MARLCQSGIDVHIKCRYMRKTKSIFVFFPIYAINWNSNWGLGVRLNICKDKKKSFVYRTNYFGTKILFPTLQCRYFCGNIVWWKSFEWARNLLKYSIEFIYDGRQITWQKLVPLKFKNLPDLFGRPWSDAWETLFHCFVENNFIF